MHPTQHSTITRRPAPPPFRRAADDSTFNPTLQQQRITALLQASADTLFALGDRPHTRCRVIQPDHRP